MGPPSDPCLGVIVFVLRYEGGGQKTAPKWDPLSNLLCFLTPMCEPWPAWCRLGDGLWWANDRGLVSSAVETAASISSQQHCELVATMQLLSHGCCGYRWSMRTAFPLRIEVAVRRPARCSAALSNKANVHPEVFAVPRLALLSGCLHSNPATEQVSPQACWGTVFDFMQEI